MNNILKRLKSNAGETLVESMCAILIFTFASIIMLSMVSAAADINTKAKEADTNYYDQLVDVEMAEGTGTAGTVTFTFGGASGPSETVSVDVFTGEGEEPLYAYYAKP